MVVRHPQTNELVTFYANEARALFDLIHHPLRGCSTRYIARSSMRSIVEKLGPCVEVKTDPRTFKQRYFLAPFGMVKVVDFEDGPLPVNPYFGDGSRYLN